MRLLKRFCLLILGLVTALALSSVVCADAVTDWNAIAIQTIAGVPSHPGATSFLDSAMVQAAVYDAVEAINGHTTYTSQEPPAQQQPPSPRPRMTCW